MIELHDSTTLRPRFAHVWLAWGLTLLAPVASAQECTDWSAEFVAVEGRVELNRAESSEWLVASRGEFLCVGDSVRVLGYSRAALRLPDESVLRLDQNTTLRWVEEDDRERSLFDLLEGIIHVISRDPRSLRFSTPFANAGLEGTEFLIEVDRQSTEITVVEGVVSMSTATDEIALEAGERGHVTRDAVPTIELATDIQGALRWALYYAPIWREEMPMPDESLPADRANDPEFYAGRAAGRLFNGSVGEAEADIARALAIDPNSPDALALEALIATASNETSEALRLAASAVASDPESITALLALSRAQLAAFDLTSAQETLEVVIASHPDDAIGWATIAEIYLATGNVADAVRSAQRATDLDPAFAHAYTVLGFAELMSLTYDRAEASFETAIGFDQAAPLPRLGLGLSLIRKGRLDEGRREFEVAVLLSPNDPLLRSYVAKAYFDERRDSLSLGQLELARYFDPLEPTALIYDSIQQQAANRPIPALHDVFEAAALSDRDVAYRSRLRLDEDLAVRSAGRARTYRDLGFEQLALAEGWQSVLTAAGDYSGHRLLADTYSSLPRHQIARVNELFVSQLLQPMNLTAIPPQLGSTSFFISDSSGTDSLAHNEYSPLLTSNHWKVQGAGIAGGNNTRGEHITVSGIDDQLSYSLGQFDLQSDGFRENNDLDTRVRNAFIQYRVGASTSLSGEIRTTETVRGDLRQLFDREKFNRTLRQDEAVDSVHLGFHRARSDSSRLIGAIQYQEGASNAVSGSAFSFDGRFDDYAFDLQSMQRHGRWQVTSGINLARQNIVETTRLNTSLPFPPFEINEVSTSSQRTEQLSTYAYGDVDLTGALTATIGVGVDVFDDRQGEKRKVNPKLGVLWRPAPRTTVRAAAFRTLQGFLVSKDSIRPRLEPTQVAGFNQFFFGTEGEEATRVGLAIDQNLSSRVYFGAEISGRTFDQEIVVVEPIVGPTSRQINVDESLGRAYVYWTPGTSLAVSAEFQREQIDNNGEVLADGYARLSTMRIPIGLRYFRSGGFRAGIETTFVDQSGSFGTLLAGPGGLENVLARGSDSFWVTDAFLGYKLPGRHGDIGLYIQNLFDETFRFQDTDPEFPGIVPERQIAIRFTLSM